jgi:hypothetical protein
MHKSSNSITKDVIPRLHHWHSASSARRRGDRVILSQCVNRGWQDNSRKPCVIGVVKKKGRWLFGFDRFDKYMQYLCCLALVASDRLGHVARNAWICFGHAPSFPAKWFAYKFESSRLVRVAISPSCSASGDAGPGAIRCAHRAASRLGRPVTPPRARVMCRSATTRFCSVGGVRALTPPARAKSASPDLRSRRSLQTGRVPPTDFRLLPLTRSRRRAGVHARTLRRQLHITRNYHRRIAHADSCGNAIKACPFEQRASVSAIATFRTVRQVRFTPISRDQLQIDRA